MTFLRQIALLLPSAFLLGALLFLLTHGRSDPAFATYSFFEQIVGPGASAATPEVRFLAQAGLLFLPLYVAALLLVWAISFAETAVFGRADGGERSAFRHAFAAVFSVVFMASSAGLLLWADRAAGRAAPGALLAPALAAAAPFLAGAVALVPSALIAAPLARLRKAGEA